MGFHHKLVTKTIANRLKIFLPNLISRSQSSFALGRPIIDSVIVEFELLHSLGKKNNGKKGFMVLKLDMSKSYNQVEWPFVIKVMEGIVFPVHWSSLIYDCISTTILSFCVNGSLKGRVIPFRGLKQGCSLSPYLLLLCAKAFYSLIRGWRRMVILWV